MTVTGKPLDVLGQDECLSLISPGGIGRVAFGGSHGPTVLPVNYQVHRGAIVFRVRAGGAMDQDLNTGVKGVDIKIAFQVDRIDETSRSGWSVLVQGGAHHVSETEAAFVTGTSVEPWADGERDLYIRIVPTQITGRRLRNL